MPNSFPGAIKLSALLVVISSGCTTTAPQPQASLNSRWTSFCSLVRRLQWSEDTDAETVTAATRRLGFEDYVWGGKFMFASGDLTCAMPYSDWEHADVCVLACAGDVLNDSQSEYLLAVGRPGPHFDGVICVYDAEFRRLGRIKSGMPVGLVLADLAGDDRLEVVVWQYSHMATHYTKIEVVVYALGNGGWPEQLWSGDTYYCNLHGGHSASIVVEGNRIVMSSRREWGRNYPYDGSVPDTVREIPGRRVITLK